jgi:small-conductance mechanosensitive channel
MGDVKEIENIPILSFALIVAIVLAITMFVVGIIMAIFGFSMMPFFNPMHMVDEFNHMYSGMSALWFVVMMPIMMFIYGFLIAAFAAIVYNLLAPRIGGIKLKYK